jgi:NADH-quinone oxidoreductase subunit N
MLVTQLFENHFKLFIPEFFFSTSILTLVLYGSIFFISEYNFPLVSKPTCYLSTLIVFGTSILVFYTKDVSCVIFNGVFICDVLSQNTKFFILLGGFVCLIINLSFVKIYKINSFEYFLLLLLALLGLLLLCSSFDVMAVYLSIELQSLCLYVLAAFLRESAYSTEAGLKYFILGASSSGLLLFGFSFLYGFSGLTSFESIYLFCFLEEKTNFTLQTVISFISCAILFKLAIVPFHFWSPDIYEGSPLNSTIFFALVPKIAFLLLFLRIFLFCFGIQFYMWQTLLFFSAFASILVGSFSALKQRKLKRLLAFSSISHIGYIFLAISSLSNEGVQASFFYILVYMFMSSGIWSFISCFDFYLISVDRPRTISDLLHVKLNKTLAFSGAMCFFSMAGIPPFVGFFAKYFIFLSTIQLSLYVISVCVVLVSVVSTFYYIRLVKVLFFEKASKSRFFKPIPKEISFVLNFSSIFTCFFFFNPNLLWLLSYQMASCIVF